MFSLYLHIPFCARVCAYCDFAVLQGSSRIHQRFVDLVLREAGIRHLRDAGARTPETVYWGGGTPTELSPTHLLGLGNAFRQQGLIAQGMREFTVECNPESISEERISTLLDLGVDRWSLGVQSFEPGLLERIGRRGDPDVARLALQRLVKTGGRVSADLMFSLPGQTVPMFLRDLNEIADVGVGHISFYGLTVEKRTLLGQWESKGIIEIPEEIYADCYQQGTSLLSKRGIHRYEVSNYCKDGQESLHNRNYWERGEYLGLGPGAHSFLNSVRWAAPRSFPRWAEWVEAGCPLSGMEQDLVGPEESLIEEIWLALRQTKGLDLKRFPLNPTALQPYLDKGWLVKCNNIVRVEGEGWIFLDQIVQKLIA